MVYPVPNSGFSRTYVLVADNEIAVVDPGSLGAAQDARRFIEKELRREMRDMTAVMATHFHIDHIGGIGTLLSCAGPETRVFFHARVRDYVENKRPVSFMKNWYLGLRPAAWKSVRYLRKAAHLMFDSLAGIPLPGIRNLSSLPYDKTRIVYFGGGSERRYPLGFDGWDVIDTPGHTEDSVSFYREATGELLCGDLIINMEENGRGRVNRFYSSRAEIMASFDFLLRTVQAKIVYPGHGEPIRDKENALSGVEPL
jgi:glyoxylase-like metal-dependent hydrolase (beta-lactamase superfamily II)